MWRALKRCASSISLNLRGSTSGALWMCVSNAPSSRPSTVCGSTMMTEKVYLVRKLLSVQRELQDQGTLEKGGKLFSSVDGTWTVPTASQHKAGEAEFSASWVGIGGGCVDRSEEHTSE